MADLKIKLILAVCLALAGFAVYLLLAPIFRLVFLLAAFVASFVRWRIQRSHG